MSKIRSEEKAPLKKKSISAIIDLGRYYESGGPDHKKFEQVAGGFKRMGYCFGRKIRVCFIAF